MNTPSIRQLAVSLAGERIAAAEFEQRVHVWDLATRSPVSTFDTILDFGGRRLAIAGDGRYCVVGAFRTHGVACYLADSGSGVWRRKDIKRIQRVRFSPDNLRVIVGCDRAISHILARETGETLAVFRGVKDVIESPWQPILLSSENSLELRTLEHQRITTIPRVTFTELDAAFGPCCVCISESTGPVRCCDSETGRELWRHWEDGRHVLRLCCRSSDHCFLGVDWAYRTGGNHRLLRFDAQTGHVGLIADIGQTAKAEFCLEGMCLVTAEGDIMDTRTGTVLARLWSLSQQHRDAGGQPGPTVPLDA